MFCQRKCDLTKRKTFWTKKLLKIVWQQLLCLNRIHKYSTIPNKKLVAKVMRRDVSPVNYISPVSSGFSKLCGYVHWVVLNRTHNKSKNMEDNDFEFLILNYLPYVCQVILALLGQVVWEFIQLVVHRVVCILENPTADIAAFVVTIDAHKMMCQGLKRAKPCHHIVPGVRNRSRISKVARKDLGRRGPLLTLFSKTAKNIVSRTLRSKTFNIILNT